MQILEHQLHQLKMLVLKLREEMQQQDNFIGVNLGKSGTLMQLLRQLVT
jgi:hypothetical protein